MTKVEVYRLENPAGEGPYRAWTVADFDFVCIWDLSVEDDERQEEINTFAADLCEVHQDTRPLPSYDGLDLWESGDWRFGCPSFEALCEWFDGWMEAAQELGCVIVRLTVWDDGVRYGDSGTQVMFDLNDVVSREVIG